MAGESKGAVFIAVIGNSFLTAIKFVAFLISGSGAMMSETIHSFADTANQGLLYIGQRQSLRPADDAFQYGYGADRYVFALLSASGIFFLGCGVTVYHGIHSLLHPPELQLGWLTFAVLGISFTVDGYVLRAAVAQINRERGERGFLAFIRSSTDPTLIAVLFEDTVATAGVIIAATGLILAEVSGNPIFDALSSIAIGALLGILAIWLGWRNRHLLLGPPLAEKTARQVTAFLESQPGIAGVRKMRSRLVGAKHFSLAVEVDYDGATLGRAYAEWLRQRAAGATTAEEWEAIAGELGEMLMDALGKDVDRVEKELVERFPRLRDIDLEAD
jgi:zinc transporter 9